MKYWYYLCQLGLSILLFPGAAYSQIVPDATLRTNLVPNAFSNGDRIDGGVIRGNSLFQSFQEFNINAGRSVYFTNPTDITNIFTRVTGTNPSNINGKLGVLGEANLFLMNPNGIVFGAGSSLDIKGSFLGTTASSINFADGTQFATGNMQVNPLLTVSVPVGLGFGSNPGAIHIQGTGHQLNTPLAFSTIIGAGQGSRGLRVESGKTLALIGGNISLDGGVITMPQGRIELGSINTGTVGLNSISEGWSFDYRGVQSLADIQLIRESALDATGTRGGSIKLTGDRITLADGSIVLIQNRGSQASGDITVNADRTLKLIGASPNLRNSTTLITETAGAGNGGNIHISTKELSIQQGARISSVTFNSGKGGDTNINATEFGEVIGFLRTNPPRVSTINTTTFGTANAGNINFSTRRLTLQDGGIMVTSTVGSSGKGGIITINASDFVEITGFEPQLGQISALSATTSSSGDAGSIAVNTAKLALRSGGRVSASTQASGNAGSVVINAKESVDIRGMAEANKIPSQVVSAANLTPNPVIRQILRLPDIPSGNSGSVTINTPKLSVTDGALVSVRNSGTGNAGTAKINAGSILLNNEGAITAATQSGRGSNIELQAQTLLMRNNSNITTTAGGTGDGGNINIDVGAITQLENSDITANAVVGQGGNINIKTQGIFNSPDSDITASSQLGISGEVNISTTGTEQENNLTEQSSKFMATERVVATSCLVQRNVRQGKFVVTGNGGLPQKPSTYLQMFYPLVEVRSSFAPGIVQKPVNTTSANTPWKFGDPIVEAQSLQVIDGKVLLTAASDGGSISQTPDLNCNSHE